MTTGYLDDNSGRFDDKDPTKYEIEEEKSRLREEYKDLIGSFAYLIEDCFDFGRKLHYMDVSIADDIKNAVDAHIEAYGTHCERN